MKEISIVIPAFNEEGFIAKLLDSLEKLRYPKSSYEVIVVNDGSTDRTAEIVQRYAGVRLINLSHNLGRYDCRKKGAESATYPRLLFIDAHSIVDPEILSVLNEIDAKVVNGRVEEVENPGPFETFYRALRRLLFPKFYSKSNESFYLTPANFDSMPKGTGVFYVEKDVLFSAYQDLADTKMGKDSSDDTRLLKAVVAREPILNHPKVKITYLSRSSVNGSVRHLYERGPKFVDYYLNPSLRNFWLVIIFPFFVMALALAGLIFLPFSPLTKLGALLGLDLVIALVLARSMREALIIFWVLPLCVIIFYTGISRGIILKFLMYLQR